jgi:hypothetical protein
MLHSLTIKKVGFLGIVKSSLAQLLAGFFLFFRMEHFPLHHSLKSSPWSVSPRTIHLNQFPEF